MRDISSSEVLQEMRPDPEEYEATGVCSTGSVVISMMKLRSSSRSLEEDLVSFSLVVRGLFSSSFLEEGKMQVGFEGEGRSKVDDDDDV